MHLAGQQTINENKRKLKGENGLVDQIRLSFVVGNTVDGNSPPTSPSMGIQFWAILATPKP